MKARGRKGLSFKSGKERNITNLQVIISCRSIRVGFVSEFKAQSSFSV